MDISSSQNGGGTALYAMKQANEAQGQGVMRLLESADAQKNVDSAQKSVAQTLGMGVNIDIKA